jgi:magnesium-transporting ATPase (P-type)
MFWHGRKFAMTFMNYSNWYIFKSLIFSITLLYFNIYTLFSGVSFFDNMYYALYNVAYTNLAIGIYTLFE